MINNLTVHLTVALALLSAQAIAQQKTVSGTVVDERGKPLAGVNVIVKEAHRGTATDFDGKYHIKASPGQRLQFSYIGYNKVSKPIGESNVLDVQLRPANETLQEVVVAYGKAEKPSVAGSATAISLDAIEKSSATTLSKALSGLSPGVEVFSKTSQPGYGAQIRIRGYGSINTSNDPLFVVDGLPNGTIPELSDIASVTILKDAAAAALYGSRAGNGVVVITTKKGKAGKTVFNLKMETSYADFAVKTLPLASPKEAFDYRVLSVKNYLLEYDKKSFPSGKEEQAQAYATAFVKTEFPLYDPNRPDSDYDWIDALFKTGSAQTVEFSASGGSKKTQIYTSLNYREVDGVAVGSDFKRISGLLNLTHKASDLLEFGFNNGVQFKDRDHILDNDYYYTNPMSQTRLGFLSQLIPIKEKNGSWTAITGKMNPVRELGLTKHQERIWDNFNQGYIKLSLTKGLTLQSKNSLNITHDYSLDWNSPKSKDGSATKGSIINGSQRALILQTSNTLTYNKTFRKAHNIDFLMGYEAQASTYREMIMNGTNIPAGGQTLDLASKPRSVYSHIVKDKTQSVLSRLKYNYNDKYYGTLSYRTDASSRLAKRWGSFFSLSGTWKIFAERWMEGIPFVNDWLVRASLGSNGKLPNELGGIAYLGLYSYGHDYSGSPGIWYDAIYNKDLGWEKNNTYGIATEAKLFDLLSLEFEYYQRITKDLLLQVPVSRVTGFSSQFRNVGEMSNKGFELGISTVNINQEDFFWKSGLNLAHNKNRIEKLYGGADIVSNAIFPLIRREGESINSFYLRDWAGVNPKNGHGQWYVLEDERRVDKDGDGKYDVTEDYTKATKRIVGCGDPGLTGTLNNEFSYKGLDLSFSLYFKLGGDAYSNAIFSVLDDGRDLYAPVQKLKLKDYWKKPGDHAKLPKVVAENPQWSNCNSSRRVLNASYARLKNIALGYSLPKSALSKLHLSELRLYIIANNLLTFTGIDGFDPETDASGYLWSKSFPPMKNINFGLQVKF